MLIPPLPPLALISDSSFDNFQQAVLNVSDRVWTAKERAEGRHVYAGQTKADWPHFKAYFEQLGWEVEAIGTAEHSGYVPNACIKLKTE